MKDGFVRVAAASPKLKVADCTWNTAQITELIEEAAVKDCRVLVFPELGITGYTCGDLFLQETLLTAAENALSDIAAASTGKKLLLFIGCPLQIHTKLYNTAVALYDGRILGVVPKQMIPNYSEFYESRHFTAGTPEVTEITLLGQTVPFGANLLFSEKSLGLCTAAEICEDLWVAIPPSSHHALAGANLLVNLSASNETIGKKEYRRELVQSQSARTLSAYVYADAGDGESTTDLVFSGHDIIAENGTILAETKLFENGMTTADIDLQRLASERRRIGSYQPQKLQAYREVIYGAGYEEKEKLAKLLLTRTFSRTPFVLQDESGRKKRSEEIIMMQATGLKKRLSHIKAKNAVLGISGGLDSTLALLVTCKAFDLLSLDRKGIRSVTMPCFGTTDRTYQNAVSLAMELGTTLMEISIADAVRGHFADISHDEKVKDVVYENAQARERTQILMDLANACGGIVVGTGDMSELALGWATYNGDHMSMYGVNASIPKTLVRHLVDFFAQKATGSLQETLKDILDTPVSPELLPPENGVISQKTEDLVGPYELHDFYLYYMLRYGFTPSKIFRLACLAFEGSYDEETMLHWLEIFYRRFFSQQYKRSCIPDGPKVGSVALSPRGDLRMPSDACAGEWMKELQAIKNSTGRNQ